MFYEWLTDLMEIVGLEPKILRNPIFLHFKPAGLCRGMAPKFKNKAILPCEVCNSNEFNECWGIME